MPSFEFSRAPSMNSGTVVERELGKLVWARGCLSSGSPN